MNSRANEDSARGRKTSYSRVQPLQPDSITSFDPPLSFYSSFNTKSSNVKYSDAGNNKSYTKEPMPPAGLRVMSSFRRRSLQANGGVTNGEDNGSSINNAYEAFNSTMFSSLVMGSNLEVGSQEWKYDKLPVLPTLGT